MEPSIKATKPLVRGGKKKKKRAADAELSALVEACGAAAPSAKRKKKQRKLSPPTAPHPAAGGQAATALAAKYAWDTDYGDHFETSEQAFRDVAPALRQLCGAGAGAAILDPYYCDGAAETRLRALGFRNATNPATDFYASRAYREPGDRSTFDALVTNPPYSGDHKERCLAFALACGRPFALLLPAYVAEKKYFADACARTGAAPFFVSPARGRPPYEYAHPHGTGKAAAPFASAWVVDSGRGAAATAALFEAVAKLPAYAPGAAAAAHRSRAALAGGGQLREGKRPNPRQRKKKRARAVGA